jgi:hypothetical protein
MDKPPIIRQLLPSVLARAIIAIAICVLFAMQPRAAHACATEVLRDLAVRATDQDPEVAGRAISRLRDAGPTGLAALMEANAAAIQRHRAMDISTVDDQWPRICVAIDTVAAQKDAWASGLYWYTDLEAATQAAKESGKPILSLRLLGTLDTEFSCANSRFFRTVLYANAEVSNALSSRFILHWKSVRPVPKVTIDFGDGRVVERTITGNSIHYVLDSDGRVIDGIPGLYGPKVFLRLIDEAAAHAADMQSPKGAASIQEWHAAKADQILRQWAVDLRKCGEASDPLKLEAAPAGNAKVNPTALAAARLAVGKSVVERPLVAALAPDPKALETGTTTPIWAKIAALRADDSRLDSTSRAVMAAKRSTASASGRATESKEKLESYLEKIAPIFERSISEDTVRNEYLFHRQIHAWLAQGKLSDGTAATDVNALNERVYADLFLTPSTDPWLGLLPSNAYSALLEDGFCKRK